MPEATHAETGAAQKTSEGAQNSNNAEGQAQQQAKETPLTKAELTGILSEFRNSINADIRKATTKTTSEKVEKKAEEDTTLTARVRAMEEREARQRERERLNAVKTALIDGGVPAKNADRAAKLVLLDHDKKIQVNPETFAVTYQESEDKATTINEWVGAYLKTDDGKFFLPAKATPGAVEGSAGSSGGTGGEHPGMKMTYAELMKAGNENIASSFRKAHPDKWEEKRRNGK